MPYVISFPGWVSFRKRIKIVGLEFQGTLPKGMVSINSEKRNWDSSFQIGHAIVVHDSGV